MVVKKTLVKSLKLEKLILDNLIEKIDLIKLIQKVMNMKFYKG